MNWRLLRLFFVIFEEASINMYRKLFLYLFLLFNCVCTNAQESNYLFQRLGVKDGLFEETVHAVQQDAKGFLWLNFRTLIQRYDGYRLLSFYPGTQLPEGNIRSMIMDKKSRLWILSGDATLGYLNPDDFKYNPVKVNIPKGFNPIVTVAYLNRSNEMMLIWDKQGFITYSNETDEADEKYNPFTFPKGWEPMHLWQDDDLNYWAGTVNGLIKYNTSKKIVSYRGHNEDNDAAIRAFEQMRNINSVYLDKTNNFWVLTWEGGLKILSYNTDSGKQIDWAPKINPIVNKYYVPYGFTETSGGELWLTGSSLFCKINVADETLQLIPQQSSSEYSILYDLVFSIYEDKEKNIWVGTNKGLFRFNPQGQLFTILKNKRTDFTSLSTETTDFLETKDGELLVSTWGDGIFSYSGQMKPVASANLFQQSQTKGTMAWSMIQRANGDVWCGMQGPVVYIFEAGTKKFIQQPVPLAEGKTIRQLAIDKNENIWLGTHGGAVIQWNASQKLFTKYLQVNVLISRIYVDSQNQIWVGTDKDGLYCINSTNGKVLKHYTSSVPKGKRLMINGVADILQYDDSTFYIAGNGLSILNTKTNFFKYFTVADGLPSANISNLLKDKNGYVWMTSGSGIISIHPVKKRMSQYNAEDGVPNFNFNTGAAAVLKNGMIVFGTNKDIVLFNPDSLSSRIYFPPKIYISGVEVMGKSINVDSISRLSVAELNPQQNSFKVLFTTLQYKDDYTVHYMLEGIDKKWKQADKTNEIEYNYLPAGKYILKLTCFREDGSHGEVTALTFHIAAPFYKQWWFYSLIILAVSGLLVWLDRERMKRKEAMQNMRSNIAGKLHDEVNVALNNINILSEIAFLKADTEPQKSKEFIEQIHSKSHNMIVAMDDMLWSISPENDSMEKTIERMREFIDAQMNRHAVHIELMMDERVKQLNLPMQLRHEAFLLFKESINGLVQAKANRIRIQMGQDKSFLLFMIECDNEHCDISALNHFLNNREMAARLEAMGAKLDVHVHKSNAVVECRVPLQQA
jgi:ligand-binding sensor domain-containing protein